MFSQPGCLLLPIHPISYLPKARALWVSPCPRVPHRYTIRVSKHQNPVSSVNSARVPKHRTRVNSINSARVPRKQTVLTQPDFIPTLSLRTPSVHLFSTRARSHESCLSPLSAPSCQEDTARPSWRCQQLSQTTKLSTREQSRVLWP